MAAGAKWVVFDVPSEAALLAGLRAHLPDRAFCSQTAWRLSDSPPDGIPVWFWNGSAEEFAAASGEILRTFIYPLVASGGPFVVAVPFGRGMFTPTSLNLTCTDRLNLEDIGRLLLDNAADTTLDLLPHFDDRLALTPIERQLSDAFAAVGVAAQPQVKLGPFRADFLVEQRGHRVVVEADGRGYHDAATDEERDRSLKAMGINRVFRFSGSQIYRGPEACALAVRAYLEAPAPRVRHATDDKLDPSQTTAARHHGGAARVLAPAGSGKTKTMVAHVLELLRQGVPPGSVLVLAFNRKAAEQLHLQLGHFGVPLTRDLVPYSEGVFCSTFHAFGYRYQAQMLQRRPKIEADERPWRDLMEQALSDTGIRIGELKPVRGSDPLGQFLKALDRVKADLQLPDQVEVEIESFGSTGNQVIGFEPVFAAFQRRQLAAGISSFEDQLYITLRDLLQSPERRRALQCRFEHVLVDEFQDLNEVQLALIDVLSRPHRKLFAVGDDDQLIYGWRFAKPGNILDFHARVPPKPYSATYTLSTNYRCSRAIVETSRRLIDRNRRREPKDFRAAPNAPAGSVRFFPSSSWNDRAVEIARFLRTEKARLDCKWQNLAVLCRYKSQQPPVAMALDAAGIPRSPLLKYRLYTHQTAHLLRAYLDTVLDPHSASGEQLALILNRPNRYLKQVAVDRIASSPDPWLALLKWRDAGHLAPRSVASFIRSVEVLHGQASSMPSGHLLESIIRDFELERFWADQSRRAKGMAEDEGDPLQVVNIIRMLADDLPNPERFCGHWNEMRDKELQRTDVQEDELAREEPEHDDHVVIGTIHTAKGREYRAVVLVDYDPDLSRMSDAESEEERRVLYVGVTRARQSLLLTIDERRPVNTLITELINPRQGRDEEGVVRDRIARLRSEVLESSAEAERCRGELRAIDDGSEATRLDGILKRQRDTLAAKDEAIQAVCFEYEGISSGGSPAIDGDAIRPLKDAHQAVRLRLGKIQSGQEALAKEQADARSRGGWTPSTEGDRARWEAELDRLRQRARELEIEADRLDAEQNRQGWRAALDRLSGKQAQLAQQRQQRLNERDRLADQLTAMLQLKEVTEALSRRDREYRDARTEADLLERQITLCESFHRLRTERGSLEVEVRKTEDRVNILRSRPDLLRAELLQRVREVEQRAAQAESDQAALESRLVELTVLGD